MTVTINLFTVNGEYGTVEGPAGAENETLIPPVTAHVKNILRALKARGVRHHLMERWAETPDEQLELPAHEAVRGPAGQG